MGGRPILVADDDTTILDLVCTILAGEGYEVICVHNGWEAVEAIGRQRPSLVVLDVHMPRLDAYGFVHECNARGYDPPILIMTATARQPAYVAEQVGAQGHLGKPFDVAELLAEVERLRIPSSNRVGGELGQHPHLPAVVGSPLGRGCGGAVPPV
jgi:DNA-binding response OmpR family regulator